MKLMYALLFMIGCTSSPFIAMNKNCIKKYITYALTINSGVQTYFCSEADKNMGGAGNANIPGNRVSAFASTIWVLLNGGKILKITDALGNFIYYQYKLKDFKGTRTYEMGE